MLLCATQFRLMSFSCFWLLENCVRRCSKLMVAEHKQKCMAKMRGLPISHFGRLFGYISPESEDIFIVVSPKLFACSRVPILVITCLSTLI